jgi:glycosyltransferase involved in cell wall biosynthesis
LEPSRSLRIGFDGRALTSPAGGVRRYLLELFRAMAEVDPAITPVAIGGPPNSLPGRTLAVPVRWHLPTNLGWTWTGIPRAARRARIDLFHAPAYTAPPRDERPMIVTIHDVSYARHPEWYPYRRDPLRRWFYRASAQAADLVITDSEFSRGEIAAAYDIAPERIVVIPLGVGSDFTPGTNSQFLRLAPHPPLPTPHSPYVLHVGDLHARRNLGTALAAVLAVRASLPEWRSLRLVVAGTDRGVLDGLVRTAREAGQNDALEWAGQPDDIGLLSLYRGAAAFLYPSRYEGFGLPLLEAMACGVPVVAARAGSIPEVAGSAAMLIDPDDGRGFAEALAAVLTNDATVHRLREAGRARASRFTWTRTASETARVYRRLVHVS